MLPDQSLPLDPHWNSTDEYVDSLLSFVTSSTLFRNLCGGVHILDFLTRKPDLYTWVLPEDWRLWFDLVTVDDLLDLLLREDLDQFRSENGENKTEKLQTWRGYELPPASLVEYADTIRKHSLNRSFQSTQPAASKLPRHVAVGMNSKKSHEVQNFAAYVNELSSYVGKSSGEPISIVDFGSGQNYLGRTLACPPYNSHVVAIEQRHHNVEGARGMDVLAKLTKKEKVMRNKKEFKRQLAMMKEDPATTTRTNSEANHCECPVVEAQPEHAGIVADTDDSFIAKGSITYIEKQLNDGHLEDILPPVTHDVANGISADHNPKPESHPSKSLVVSIHSCGNLTHHGLRSLILNPSVRAVAMIGCCYNLLTERLGPPTYKHPSLRSNHPRLEATSSSYDPNGFPMSKKLATFQYDVLNSTLIPESSSNTLSVSPENFSTTTSPATTPEKETGVRLNITARMMAVQAPYNWTPTESHAFFKRHFYRALLQRILLDYKIVQQPPPTSPTAANLEILGSSLTGKDSTGTPLIIGTLPKPAFTNFSSYISHALKKLLSSPSSSTTFTEQETAILQTLLSDPTITNSYMDQYKYAEKHLAMIWSLMAFSANVVESVIIVDRWLWLSEQSEVKECWVKAVWEYGLSPRNMCVVGVKEG